MYFKLLLILLIPGWLQCFSWNILLENHKKSIGSTSYELLTKQYRAYVAGNAPVIADERVKQIPIIECGEKLIDITTKGKPRIRIMREEEYLLAHAFPEDIDPLSSNFSSVRVGVFKRFEHMLDELDRIAPSFGYEAGELEIVLWEGLRDIATQKALFEACSAKIAKERPELGAQALYQEVSRWVSPYLDNIPAHSTGGAFDIHLWSNKKLCFCDMGRFNSGGPGAPTFADNTNITEQQARNRLLMLIAATRAGFVNYVYEFWHFSYGDRYATYWENVCGKNSVALYNAM